MAGKLLRAYAAALTLVVGIVALTAATRQPGATFDTITAQQIRLVEPDGTLRLVISNRSRAPGVYRKNVEYPREGDPKTAGLFFLNDEGSEVGGLIFGGSKDANGKVESHGHLSFDQYAGTQVFAVQGFEDEGERSSRLRIWDWRDRPGESGRTRLTLGKDTDRTVGLTINDSAGRPRIVLRVDAHDRPEFLMLDPDGSIQSRWTPAAGNSPKPQKDQ